MKKVRRFTVPLKYDEKIITKSKYRTYYNCVLLTPGVLYDSVSNEPGLITADVLKRTANNWAETYVNIDHDRYSVLSRIGYVEPKGWNGKAVIGNIKILPVTQVAKDVIALIDEGLITDLSIEIMTEEEWNYNEQMYEVLDIEYYGVAVVTKGACPDAKIKK